MKPDDVRSILGATKQIGSYYSNNDDAMDLDPVGPAFALALKNLYNITPSRPKPPPSQPRIPREVLQRVAANIKEVEKALKLPEGVQGAQEPPSTPSNQSVTPGQDNNVQPSPLDVDALLKSLKNTLDNLPDDLPDYLPDELPNPTPGVLTVHKLFHFLRATPPTVGFVIPNSERQIWYRPTQQDYVTLHANPKGVANLVGVYLENPDYLTSYLTDGCGFVQGWILYDQGQWCTCRYDDKKNRFVTRGGSETAALDVGFRTPWAPVCNGCRGDRSVEVRVLDYLARWFSFVVPPGGDIVKIMRAWTQTEQLQQAGDGPGPLTPNGPDPELEGQDGIDYTVNSQAVLWDIDSRLPGSTAMSPTRKSKRRRGDEEVDEAGEMSKRPRVILEKRRHFPDGPSSLHDPFVDGPSASVPLPARDPSSDAGDHMMLDDDEDVGPSAAPAAPHIAPHVGTANNGTVHNNNMQAPQQPQSINPPAGGIPPAAIAQIRAQIAAKNFGPGNLPPRATVAEVLAIWAVQNRTFPESPGDLPKGQYCGTCKNPRRPPAAKNKNKCERCSALHIAIRELNFERGWCTAEGCDGHVGFPRPRKPSGPVFAWCERCRNKQQRQRYAKRRRGG